MIALPRRIHITGASGSGTTTLGRRVASVLAIPHHDTDDYFWKPTDPPYVEMRPASERLRLMAEMFVPRPGWVLSGSLAGWGDPLISQFDLVIFITIAKELRLQRVRAREATRYGAAAVAPGGARHRDTEDFVAWAAAYDEGDSVSRTRAKHETWLATLPCPVLRLDGERPIEELAERVVTAASQL
ncbi:ATP-binding protein [Bradyrhizobium sp. USDA 4353]